MKALIMAATALGLAMSSARGAEITVYPPQTPGKSGTVLVTARGTLEAVLRS